MLTRYTHWYRCVYLVNISLTCQLTRYTHRYRCVYLVNISEPVQYHIYAMAFPFDLRCQSVTYLVNTPALLKLFVCNCVCGPACARACVRACMRAWVRACICVHACVRVRPRPCTYGCMGVCWGLLDVHKCSGVHWMPLVDLYRQPTCWKSLHE